MRVQTQFGQMEINPADVISIKPVSLWADNNDYYDLTFCVEYEDESAPNGSNTACVTEPVAKELSRISGVKIPEITVMPKKRGNTVFVPFNQLLILDEWEKYFKNCVKGTNQQPEQKPVPSSFSSEDRTLYEENHQPISLIEQVFRAQNNCIQCGKLVYDESKLCSSCSNRAILKGFERIN